MRWPGCPVTSQWRNAFGHTRTGQELHLTSSSHQKSKNGGNLSHLRGFDRGMLPGARLRISKTVEHLGISHAPQNGAKIPKKGKKKTPTPSVQHLRWFRITGTGIATPYKCGKQKSISGRTEWWNLNAAAEEDIRFHSCQPRTGTWGYSGGTDSKNKQTNKKNDQAPRHIYNTL